jgi:glucose-1-phosphate adenylyltransferase
MGADYYQDEYPQAGSDRPPVGIGPHCVIDGAIIDKNARIGSDVVISPAGKPEKMDGHNFYIRDGVVVVPKGAVIPPGTKI